MSAPLRLLFLCGGRRVTLLKGFREALNARGGGRIITTDTESHPATSFVADATYQVSPCVEHEAFSHEVAQICERESVVAVLPLTCAAVAVVPALRSRVQAHVVSGDDRTIEICLDKLQTSNHFARCGVPTPAVIPTPTPEDLPLFYRLRRSEGSRSANCISTADELALAKRLEDAVFTRYLAGTEFTIDCYKDLHDNIVSIVPRERVRVRAGEVERSVIRRLPALVDGTTRVVSGLRFSGPATVQAIRVDDTFFFTEINLRYAGGVTLSISAGMASQQWLISELSGQTLTPWPDIQWGLGMSRYDEEFYYQVDESTSGD